MAKEPKSVKTDARSWLYSIGLHGAVLVILLLGVGFGVRSITQSPGTGKNSQPVKATVVSQALIDKELNQIKAAEAKKKAAQAAAKKKRQQQIEAARKAREAEQQRLAEIKHQRAAAAAAAKKKQAEAAREAKEEQQHLAALKAKREAEEKRLAEARAKAKAEAEAKAKAKAKAEAEAKAKAEAARRKREAAAKAEAERKAELQRELAAEKKSRAERAAAARQAAAQSRSLGLYTAAIEQQVERNWIRPSSTEAGLNCVVDVIQVPGGDVVNATIKSCNGDAAVKQSIISAVYKASPLPEPDDPSLFQREIEFTFAPEEHSE